MLALAVLIAVLGPVSGAHFNPAVTLADWWLHRRASAGEVAGYVSAQIVGGIGGAVLADVMFALPAVQWSTKDRSAVSCGWVSWWPPRVWCW